MKNDWLGILHFSFFICHFSFRHLIAAAPRQGWVVSDLFGAQPSLLDCNTSSTVVMPSLTLRSPSYRSVIMPDFRAASRSTPSVGFVAMISRMGSSMTSNS